MDVELKLSSVPVFSFFFGHVISSRVTVQEDSIGAIAVNKLRSS